MLCLIVSIRHIESEDLGSFQREEELGLSRYCLRTIEQSAGFSDSQTHDLLALCPHLEPRFFSATPRAVPSTGDSVQVGVRELAPF